MRLKGAHVGQVVPKRFRVELSARSKASQGTYCTSVMHGMQTSKQLTPHCNRYKGSESDIRRWRHVSMPRLLVAKRS